MNTNHSTTITNHRKHAISPSTNQPTNKSKCLTLLFISGNMLYYQCQSLQLLDNPNTDSLKNPTESHCIQLLSVQPQKPKKNKTHFPRHQLLEENWINIGWVQSWWLIKSTDPNLPRSWFYAPRGKCVVVRKEIRERGKLLRVSAPWRALLRHWTSHLFRLLSMTAGAVPI